MQKNIATILTGAAVLSLAACASPDQRQNNGALVGGALGAVVGSQVAGNRTAGAVVGGVVGAAAGQAAARANEQNEYGPYYRQPYYPPQQPYYPPPPAY